MITILDIKCSSSEKLEESWDDIGLLKPFREYGMSIYLNYNSLYRGDMYFKVFNASCFEDATKCCRIKVFKAMYKKCDDNPMNDLILNDEQKIHLMDMVKSPLGYGCRSGRPLWECMMIEFMNCSASDHINSLLRKRMHKIPDYTRLPDYI